MTDTDFIERFNTISEEYHSFLERSGDTKSAKSFLVVSVLMQELIKNQDYSVRDHAQLGEFSIQEILFDMFPKIKDPVTGDFPDFGTQIMELLDDMEAFLEQPERKLVQKA